MARNGPTCRERSSRRKREVFVAEAVTWGSGRKADVMRLLDLDAGAGTIGFNQKRTAIVAFLAGTMSGSHCRRALANGPLLPELRTPTDFTGLLVVLVLA